MEDRFSPYVLSLLRELYGDSWGDAFNALRRPSPRYFIRVNTLKASREEVMESLGSRGIEVNPYPPLEEALYIDVKGPFQVDSLKNNIVVDKFTAESVLQGAHVYAPGIVKCKGLRRGDKVTILDDTGGVVADGVALMDEREILRLRRGLAVLVVKTPYRVSSLRETSEYHDGWIYPQSMPAMVTSRVLDPKPGDVIADLNCAPGGKTSHISQLTGNMAHVYAMDRTARKIEVTRETLNRLGCRNIHLFVQDSRYVHQDRPDLKVDKCVVDPPCSALGVTPKVYEYIGSSSIRALAEYQKQFIKAASMILEPGGTMTYSVCTITPEECEGVVEYAVNNCNLVIAPQSWILGEEGFPDYFEEAKHLQRFHPHIHGVGYFIAKFIKV
ncbi:MAG: RsmB/NOP family class I SAM-dependent RNA methyltransferase [Candidatus Bathyarchaeia archaeon]